MLSERLDGIRERALNDVSKRSEAIAEIEIAFAAADESSASPDQLADLADAVDAFKERAYGVAAALARASSRPRHKVDHHRRPDAASLSLAELRDTFGRLHEPANGN